MPVSCVAFGCTNRYVAGQEINFFRFPLNDELLISKWINSMKRKNFKPTKWSRICSVHFKKDDFQLRPDAHRPLLKKDAVPTIFPSFPSYYKKEQKKPRKEPAIRISNIDENTIEKLENSCIMPLAITPDCNSACDNVQTTTTHINEELLKRKIKTLQQKIRRQDIKINNMTNLLNALQKKGFVLQIPK